MRYVFSRSESAAKLFAKVNDWRADEFKVITEPSQVKGMPSGTGYVLRGHEPVRIMEIGLEAFYRGITMNPIEADKRV